MKTILYLYTYKTPDLKFIFQIFYSINFIKFLKK